MDGPLFGTNSIREKSSRIILCKVHGVKKILNTNVLPEKQKIAPQVKKGSEIKPNKDKVE